jgi:hypothetical protein
MLESFHQRRRVYEAQHVTLVGEIRNAKQITSENLKERGHGGILKKWISRISAEEDWFKPGSTGGLL